jgi:hypothetical protein
MNDETRATSMGGAAVLGAMVIGVAAFILAFISLTGGRFEAAGIALVAGATAFVGVANAIFRH